MRPLAGDYAFILFAFGLFNASLFAASILPLSTAYTVCEGLGLESGVDKSFSEAPFFYWLYTLLIAGGAVTFSSCLNAAHQLRHPLAGAQRRSAARRHHPHAAAHQPPRPDGRVQELAPLERHRLEHQHHRHRHDLGDALGHDPRPLSAPPISGSINRHEKHVGKLQSARKWVPQVRILGPGKARHSTRRSSSASATNFSPCHSERTGVPSDRSSSLG